MLTLARYREREVIIHDKIYCCSSFSAMFLKAVVQQKSRQCSSRPSRCHFYLGLAEEVPVAACGPPSYMTETNEHMYASLHRTVLS